MIFVHQAGLAFLLVTLTLWFQSAGIGGLTTWARRALEGDISKLGPLRSADLLVRFTTAVVALHAWRFCCRRAVIAGFASRPRSLHFTFPQPVTRLSAMGISPFPWSGEC